VARNLLDQETSPYLLQHKDNPVHWHPWGEDAFAAAKAADKPVLLSIGYAACHWCHVMAHECFEAPEIAGLMNDKFINIKVDREERPEIDAIYMSALTMMGQHGGWPLTMFLTPDKKPYYGGTYFPPTARHGLPGFPDVLTGIANLYDEQRDRVLENVAALTNSLENAALAPPKQHAGLYDRSQLDAVAEQALSIMDPVHGGTQGAPKFPQPVFLSFLWRAYLRTKDKKYLDAVTLTLTHISGGGIYDHLGGGYARYSTDKIWLAPHFEKMLYDNAQIIELLMQVGAATGNELFELRLRETIAWALRELATDEGAFAGTLDADSEGEEGTFYVWSEAEIDDVLGQAADKFKPVYDVTPGGNWEGKTILNRLNSLDLLNSEAETALKVSRDKLLAARDRRIRPGLDDKLLTDWNGMMIAALASAGAMFGEADWIVAATRALEYFAGLADQKGRLRHSARGGIIQNNHVLDDYAQMIRAALALYQAAGNTAHLAQAVDWARIAKEDFWDDKDGGYFLSGIDNTDVFVRTRSAIDNATPSGNGTMAENLARLYFLTGQQSYRDDADAVIDLFARLAPENYLNMPGILNAFDFLCASIQVVIAGEGEGADRLLAAAHRTGHPNMIIDRVGPDRDLPDGHPAAGKALVDGKAAAYICIGVTCSLPLNDAQSLKDALGQL